MQIQQRESLIKRFLSDLEKIDLCLNEVKQYGIILVGLNISGKSIAAQQLCGKQIKNINQFEDINQSGQHRPSSIIPAFQTLNLSRNNNQQLLTSVVDSIGYRQWACIYDTLIQGYSHFRLYSMFQNIKFIICFDSNYLHPIPVIQTLRQFVSYFKNPRQIIADIKKSCAFLFTNLRNCECLDLVKIKNKMIQIRNQMGGHMDQIQIEAIRSLIDYVVQNNRMYTMNHFDCQTVKQKSGSYKKLLSKIQNQIDSWWSRNFHEINVQQTIEQITLPLAPKIIYLTTRYEKFKKQYTQLIKYLYTKTRYIVQTPYVQQNKQSRKLFFVIGKLVYDAMGQLEACTFMDLIREQVQTQYLQNYDNQYRLLRQNKQRNLFGQQENQDQLQENNSYLIKKFKALQNIQSIKDKFIYEHYSDDSFEPIQTFQNRISSIIRQLSQLCRADNQVELVYKYGYMIHRWLQQRKFILTIQLCDSQRYQYSSKMRQASGHIDFSINRPFKDSMLCQYYYNQQYLRYEELIREDLTNISHDHFQFHLTTPLNIQLIDMILEQNEATAKKLILLMIRWIEKQFQANDLNDQNKIKLLKPSIIVILNLEKMYSLSNQENEKYDLIFMMRTVSTIVGKWLQSLNKFQLARKFYKKIFFVESVCNNYEADIKALIDQNQAQENYKNKIQALKTQYAQFCKSFNRIQPMIILYKKFESANKMKQLNEICQDICSTEYQINPNPDKINQFVMNMFDGKLFLELDYQIQEQIMQLK